MRWHWISSLVELMIFDLFLDIHHAHFFSFVICMAAATLFQPCSFDLWQHVNIKILILASQTKKNNVIRNECTILLLLCHDVFSYKNGWCFIFVAISQYKPFFVTIIQNEYFLDTESGFRREYGFFSIIFLMMFMSIFCHQTTRNLRWYFVIFIIFGISP